MSAAVLCAALGGIAGSRQALADQAAPAAEAVPASGWLSKWHVDREHPEANSPTVKDRNADPLEFGYWLQDLVWKAERAAKSGDHALAAKLYMALATAVPDRAIALLLLACQEIRVARRASTTPLARARQDSSGTACS